MVGKQETRRMVGKQEVRTAATLVLVSERLQYALICGSTYSAVVPIWNMLFVCCSFGFCVDW
jgi:hypothetical protein